MALFLKSRNVTLAMALLAAGCAMAADPSAGTNLVSNGGFEEGAAGWVFSASMAQAGGGVASDHAHSGTNSFRLENHSDFAPNVFARVTQVVSGLEPFTTYRISCFAMGTNAGIVWIGGGPGWYVRARFPSGSFGWTNVAIEYTTSEQPPDFELMVLTESQTQAVWVDDVRMESVRADAARRDAVKNRLKSQQKALRERLAALRDRAQRNPLVREDAVAQLGLRVAERFLDRVENTRQAGAWTSLQMEELPEVLDATEQAMSSREKSGLRPPPQPWPESGEATVRDGIFYTKTSHGREQPFWFYGYGHFAQVIRDLPNFHGLGASLVQDGQLGPSSMNADGSLGPAARQLLQDLATARRDGMKVDWLFSPHYFPEWALAQAPEARGGGPGWIAFNIDHPVVSRVLAAFAEKMSKAMVNSPALFSICLSNEPTYDQSGRNPYSRAEYLAWLRELHGSIQRLNELYGTRYANFDEVQPPPPGLKNTVEENRAYYDWVRFNQMHFAAWHAWLSSLVKKNLPRAPTHAKIMADFLLDRDKLHFGVDAELFCDATDLAGCDAYAFPAGDNNYEWIREEFFYDLLHSFRHQPVFNSENHVIPDGFPPTHIPWAASRAQFWQGGLHHQGATTTWVWEEAADPSLSGSIYFRPANVYGAGRAMLELNRFAAEAAALNQAPPRVALLYSPPSIFWEEAYKGTIQSCYRQLNFLGEPVDFISEKEMAEGRLPINEVIVAPAATHVANLTAASLRRFTAAGGRLITVGDQNFAYDEYHRPRATLEIPRALPLSAAKDEQETSARLRAALAGFGLETTAVNDAASGQPVWGVEFRRAPLGGKTIMSMIDLAGKPCAVTVPAWQGKKVVDALANETINPDHIELEPMTPRLLEAD
jgi:hypothetical protein